MVKIKYDVEEVEEFEPYAGPTPKRGVYEAVVKEAEFGDSSNGSPMFTIMVVIESSKKEHKQYNGCPLWQHAVIGSTSGDMLAEDWMKRNLKMLVKAFGLKEKGQLDPEALVKKITGKKIRVLVKNETNDGEVTAKANALLPFKGETEPEDGADDAEPEGDEPDGDEAEGEDGEDETTVEEDIAELDRAGLKKYIKDNAETLTKEVKVTKSMSDDDIRTAILAAWPEEDGDEDDDEDEDEGDDGLDEMDRAALKKHIKDNSLEIAVKKSMSDDDIRAAIRAASGDDEDEGEDGEPPF